MEVCDETASSYWGFRGTQARREHLLSRKSTNSASEDEGVSLKLGSHREVASRTTLGDRKDGPKKAM